MSDRCRAILEGPMAKAYALLPERMRGVRADVQMLAIGLQESRLKYRAQLGGGPARGLWQFELGAISGTDGRTTWGIYHHAASREHLRRACAALGVKFDPRTIHGTLDRNDVLAAVCARLLLWTLPYPLPDLGDWTAAWAQYLDAWRPGKPKPDTWGGLYTEALGAVAQGRCG